MMEWIGDALAPAKINWTLAVLKRRSDGYHEIDTVMQTLHLADRVTIRCSEKNVIRLTGRFAAGIEADEHNLASRAAALYVSEAGLTEHFCIDLEKNIPSMAGLGGGSSDAAAVLRLLEDHHGALGDDVLATLAARLGADVPFFLTGNAARCQGIGEQRTAIPAQSFALVLAMGKGGASTAAVYGRWQNEMSTADARKRAEKQTQDVLQALSNGDCRGLGESHFNDLERPACSLQPEIGGTLEQLKQAGALSVGMSGSGAACYGLFETEADATKAAGGIEANLVIATSTRENRLLEK